MAAVPDEQDEGVENLRLQRHSFALAQQEALRRV
jgi:hypothetical protein